jgi:hypothetical protein
MLNNTLKQESSRVYEQLIQNLGKLIAKYYGSDNYMPLLEDIEETYGHHITMQAEDFGTDFYFGVIDDQGNELS